MAPGDFLPHLKPCSLCSPHFCVRSRPISFLPPTAVYLNGMTPTVSLTFLVSVVFCDGLLKVHIKQRFNFARDTPTFPFNKPPEMVFPNATNFSAFIPKVRRAVRLSAFVGQLILIFFCFTPSLCFFSARSMFVLLPFCLGRLSSLHFYRASCERST